jgi:hypothetical protein
MGKFLWMGSLLVAGQFLRMGSFRCNQMWLSISYEYKTLTPQTKKAAFAAFLHAD